VEETLHYLKNRYTLAIVTTAKQTDFDLIHSSRTIVNHFDLILTHKDYARSKPHPDPYLTALSHYELDAQDALVVEDSERGLRAAIAAGIDCAVAHHDFTASQDFTGATYRLANLTALEEFL
jgi:HAD superfamily hydrolase (TIGR01509 family)